MENIITKIIQALTQKIKNKFKNIEIYSTDVEQGFKSPCFFISLNNVKIQKINTRVDNLFLNIDIIYSCEDRKMNQLEIYDISDKLNKIFIGKPINVDNDISFIILEGDTDIKEDYLSLSLDIDINLIKDNDNENLEYMEELSIKE